ncbi:variant erythrocyte surface antigen-1 family protein [Babesia caballi]|uniref:Variant erythrocyte surface antigen-1 family protein n=1 Tax=Babesia caballi TaxID=5871 RepID=A0AAV4LLX5_BABCB|nr:variant erythrocyte surface antigen-1 family protein [Babesia caballi]
MLQLDSPSFALVYLSFDCHAHLKEAIDWILRVTGKDGGGGDGDASKLIDAIVGLPDFKDAIKAVAEKLQESGSDVSEGLEKFKDEHELGPIIGKLAEGLAGFIGYGSKGQGIALVIDPLQQLRKGVLGFLMEVILTLKSNHGQTKVKDTKRVSDELSGAVKNVTDKFEPAIQRIKEVQNDNTLQNVVDALKNITDIQSKNDGNDFANGFSKYLTKVLTAVNEKASNQLASLQSSLPALVAAYGNGSDISEKINAVENDYKKLSPNGRAKTLEQVLTSAVHYGTKNLLDQLKKDGYKSAYMAPNWNGDDNKEQISKIFLGCLPLYYYWLTYLYWKCKQTRDQGGWEAQWFNGRGGGTDLKNFMVGHGYVADHLNGNKASEMIKTAFSGLTELTRATTTIQHSHTALLSALDNSLYSALPSSHSSTATLNGHSLSALFHLCRTYFTGKQIINPVTERRSPTSIREMLYWLCGLQFSPHYSDIEKQIEAFIPAQHGLPVADSGTSSPNNFITRDQMKGFLLSSCLSVPGVLGAIQGNTADTENEPWLYSLFCNSMNLQYPSGVTLFNTLANYAYALQFQLLFLYAQCRSWYSQSYGWQWCRYGQGVGSSSSNDAKELASWICKASNCTTPTCQHNSTTCQHFTQCGQQNKISPLHAFLTDHLKGFRPNSSDSISTHLDNHSPGSMCHVPMGFAGALTKDANATGWHIYYLLEHFCSGSQTPLRQLCEKLGCLTRRTPRTLGDLFGFVWHLNGQLFKSRPTLGELATKLVKPFETQSSQHIPGFLLKILKGLAISAAQTSPPSPPSSATVLSRSLEAMALATPFIYQLFMAEDSKFLPSLLFDLVQHGHKKVGNDIKHPSHESSVTSSGTCSHVNDLWSLYYPVSDRTNSDCKSGTCGGYLSLSRIQPALRMLQIMHLHTSPGFCTWQTIYTSNLIDLRCHLRSSSALNVVLSARTLFRIATLVLPDAPARLLSNVPACSHFYTPTG